MHFLYCIVFVVALRIIQKQKSVMRAQVGITDIYKLRLNQTPNTKRFYTAVLAHLLLWFQSFIEMY